MMIRRMRCLQVVLGVLLVFGLAAYRSHAAYGPMTRVIRQK